MARTLGNGDLLRTPVGIDFAASMSWWCWFKGAPTFNFGKLADTASLYVFAILRHTDGRIIFNRRFSSISGGWSLTQAAHALDQSGWCFVCVRHNGTTSPPVFSVASADFALRTPSVSQTQTPSGTVNSGSSGLYIGNDSGLDDPATCAMERVGFAPRYITDAEVREAMLYGRLLGGAHRAWRIRGDSPEPEDTGTGPVLNVTAATVVPGPPLVRRAYFLTSPAQILAPAPPPAPLLQSGMFYPSPTRFPSPYDFPSAALGGETPGALSGDILEQGYLSGNLSIDLPLSGRLTGNQTLRGNLEVTGEPVIPPVITPGDIGAPLDATGRPIASAEAELLYSRVAPLAYADAANGWALLRLCIARTSMWEPVAEIVRGVGDEPGWARALDVDRCPEALLPWLGQFVGVRLPVGVTGDEARALVKQAAGFRRGTPAAMAESVARTLTGTRQVKVKERDGSPYRLTLVTREDETPDAVLTLAAALEQKPAALLLAYGAQVTSQTYLQLRDFHGPTYADVRGRYADYADAHTDTPV